MSPRDVGALFSATHAVVARGRRTLIDDLSLTIEPGQLVQIGGANGSGKTTLLRAMAGLHPVRGGTMTTRGHRSWLAATDDQRIDLSVAKYLAVMGRVHAPGRAGRDRADEVRAELDLDTVADRTVRILSTGWRRRVAIAEALLAPTGLVLIDEPIAGLDADAAGVVWRAIGRWAGDRGAVVIASPDPVPELVADLLPEGTSVPRYVIEHGRLVEGRPGPSASDRRPFRVRLIGPDPTAAVPTGPWTAVVDDGSVVVTTPEAHLDRLLGDALTAGWSIREVAPAGEP